MGHRKANGSRREQQPDFFDFPDLLLILAELPEVFFDRVRVPRRHILVAGAAHASVAAAGFVHLAAQLHFHLLHVRQRSLYALGERGVVGHVRRVNIAQIADQVLDILLCRGIAFHLLMQLHEALQRDLVIPLEIMRIHRTAGPVAAVPVTAVPIAAVLISATAVLRISALTTAGLLSALLLAALLPALLLATLLPTLLLTRLLAALLLTILLLTILAALVALLPSLLLPVLAALA